MGTAKMKKIILSALSFSVFVPTAHADWQYTRWGMSPEEAIAQSQGALRAVTVGEADSAVNGKKLVVGTYSSNGRLLNVELWFAHSGGLSGVTLKSDSIPDCTSLRPDFESIYGKPYSEEETSLVRNWVWLDRTKGNRVEFNAWWKHTCTIYYRPLATSPATGL